MLINEPIGVHTVHYSLVRRNPALPRQLRTRAGWNQKLPTSFHRSRTALVMRRSYPTMRLTSMSMEGAMMRALEVCVCALLGAVASLSPLQDSRAERV
jgi:hypothetical protein